MDLWRRESFWFVAYAYFWAIIVPTMGFKVLECITVCSSAGSSKLHLNHCWTFGSPSHPQLLFLSPLPTPFLWYCPPYCSSNMPDMHPPHRIFEFVVSLVRMLFSWIHAGLLIFFFSLKCTQISSVIFLCKCVVFPLHLLTTLFLHYSALFFLALPTYSMFMYYLLSLPIPFIRAGAFSSLYNR